MDENNLEIGHREEEVLSSHETDQQGSADALDGQWKICKLLGHGPLMDKVTGKMGIFHRVQWEDSMVRAQDIYSDLISPPGLPPGSSKLQQAHDPNGREDPAVVFICRYCGRNLLHKQSINRHEKNCSAPGGPKHVCGPGKCLDPNNCVGPKNYEPRPDGRIDNKKGQRGPKPGKGNKKQKTA